MSMCWGKLCHFSVSPELSHVHVYDFRGQGSDSEGEELGGEGEVTLPQDLPGRGNIHSQQSAIRLSEVLTVTTV